MSWKLVSELWSETKAVLRFTGGACSYDNNLLARMVRSQIMLARVKNLAFERILRSPLNISLYSKSEMLLTVPG